MTEQKPAVVAKKIEVVSLVGVHGRIQHPYTLAWFDQGVAKDHQIDGWVKGQMEAGKIALA